MERLDQPDSDYIPIDDSGGLRLTTTPPIGLSISVLQLLRVVTASSNIYKGDGLVDQAAIDVCYDTMRGKEVKNLHVWWTTFKCQEVFGRESCGEMTYMTRLRLSIHCRMRNSDRSLCENSKASTIVQKIILRSFPLLISNGDLPERDSRQYSSTKSTLTVGIKLGLSNSSLECRNARRREANDKSASSIIYRFKDRDAQKKMECVDKDAL